jgi:hypothetical protein
VVGISEHKEDILKDWNEELLEECIRGLRICLRDIGDEFEAHVKPSILNFAIVMLAGPHARVNHKLELSVIQLEECYISVSR